MTFCRNNTQSSALYFCNPISSITFVRWWFYTLDTCLCPYRLLMILRACVFLIPPLVFIPWGISKYMSNSMLAWVKARKKSTWRVVHPLMIEINSNILMVKHVATGENFSKKFEIYSCFPPWTLRRSLCLNTFLVLMYILYLNSHIDGRTCYTSVTCSLGIISYCFRLMWALTSLIMALWNSLVEFSFVSWW